MVVGLLVVGDLVALVAPLSPFLVAAGLLLIGPELGFGIAWWIWKHRPQGSRLPARETSSPPGASERHEVDGPPGGRM
jgi:hypothetical protein